MILSYKTKNHLLAYNVVGDFFMNKKEEFKAFARMHPELLNYVRNKEMTWQQFYEIYDIYGSDEEAWSTYFHKTGTQAKSNVEPLGAITEKLKNIDMNSIQEHIKTAQKALSLVSELTGKSETTTPLTASAFKVPRPIDKFFED